MLINSCNGLVIWFVGLPASGKTTLARKLCAEIDNPVKLLDADAVRSGPLCHGLGFDAAGRGLNIERLAFVASAVADAGGICIVSAITPYIQLQDLARRAVGSGRFFMVHVDCDVDCCEQRDDTGMYIAARLGEIDNFTGVSDHFDRPEDAEVVVNTGLWSVNVIMSRILESLDAFLETKSKAEGMIPRI